MDTSTRRLAHYAFSLDSHHLTASTIHECRRRLIDAFGCAAAARAEPFCTGINQFSAQYYTGPYTARLWADGRKCSAVMAAFANGTALRYLDLSDTYMSLNGGHPSDMIGALVAVAEARHCDGAALACALVVSYEIYCSMCDAVALRDH